MPETNQGSAEHFLQRIENLYGDIDEIREKYQAECKEIRDDIQGLYREAKDEGHEPKALKGLVKYRMLGRKQDKIAETFDANERAAYDDLVDRLGDLGRAAAEAAGHYHGDDDQPTAH
jgi:uncharacterized protein (UPF0335 family)